MRRDLLDKNCEQMTEGLYNAQKRREELNVLLSSTFNTILSVEEAALQNKLTTGLTMSEIHTIEAVGLHEQHPMNVVATRLGVTLATLTTAMVKLEQKGYVERTRSNTDRRKVLVQLTSAGRAAFRSHQLFHRDLVERALEGLNEEEERILAQALINVRHFFEEQAREITKQD